MLQGAEIIGHPRHQLAGGGALEKGQGHFLKIGVQPDPQIKYEFFTQGMADIIVADIHQLPQGISTHQGRNQNPEVFQI